MKLGRAIPFLYPLYPSKRLINKIIVNMAKYYTDGWMMGSKNPSPYGGGFTIVDENNKLITRVEINCKGFTNNEAEIRGIKFALEYAVKGDTISTDSMCCLTWVRKGRSKARPDLIELLQECKKLFKEKEINLLRESRDFNLAGLYNESIQKEETKKRISGLNSFPHL